MAGELMAVLNASQPLKKGRTKTEKPATCENSICALGNAATKYKLKSKCGRLRKSEIK